MKLRPAFAVLAASAALVLVAAQAQDEHLIRFKFETGQVDRYQMEIASEMSMSGAGAGDQQFGLKGTMDHAFTLGAKDAEGKAELEMKTSNIKMAATGAAEMMMGEQQMPKEFSVKGKLDDRYRITDAKTVGLPAEAQMMMGMGGANTSALLFELPEKAVKIGDTWEVMMPKNPMLGENPQKLTAKLAGIKDFGGAPSYAIEISGLIPVDVDMAKAMKAMSESAGAAGGAGGMMDMMAGMEIRLKGTMEVTGSAFVDQKSGRLQDNETKIVAKQQMTIGGIGLTIDIAGATTVKMKWVK